ncbi:phage major capsid protein [Pacificimonas sp. WHA3]|uniref:Phage major capsid protein n=1 Tax=Pacificimonas pallii TaxID=2827236 RepID=A0ABS6SAT9_9SPHN|nr:phage major capsid protein [Pacificimonas pallii]MBV7255213.1 phage major capsid protein [Pacificimonas pallii]
MMDYEMKADEVEAAFEDAADATEMVQADIAALKDEIKGLSAQMMAVRRPALGVKTEGQDGSERKAFADAYLRKGHESAPELKSLSTTTGPEGGYAVPKELDRMIETVMKEASPIRSIANVVSVGSGDYRKLAATGGFQSGWVSEDALRPETDSPDFVEIAPPMGELYANPAASQTMLDDAAFDVESWLASEIGREFAFAEGAAFVSGDGSDMPKGFLDYATSALPDAVRTFGTLQHIDTGVNGALADGDALIDLVHSLKAAHRQGAAFVMNSATLSSVRKLKDGDGNFLWRPGLESGAMATLLGYPVVEAEAMPDLATGSLSIAFGNFKAGYVIAERTATRILRDPYSNKPFVHFYATKRVGGAVVNSEAIKLLRFSA